MSSIISVLNDFSRYPGPRYRDDGPFSGEQFREEIIEPRLKEALASGQRLKIILDGVAGYGSSFLEEAFGGLIRRGFDVNTLNSALDIAAETMRFKHHRLRALQYIDDAAKKQKTLGIFA